MKLRLLSASLAATLLLGLGAAVLVPRVDAGSPDKESSQNVEADVTEKNQKRLIEATPPPELNKSLERENLKKRLEFLNDANRLGYVYLLGFDGKVIAEYTIKGKPSSLESYMTTTEQIRCRNTAESCAALSSPDLDGSYGRNPEGIFFFTTENAYVEWSGTYMYSSQKLNIQTPLSLTRNVE